MTIPKVTEIIHIKTIIPNACSGTGYSEPDVFEFKLNDGSSILKAVDVWCRPKDEICRICKDSCYELPISNPSETLQMLLDYYDKC